MIENSPLPTPNYSLIFMGTPELAAVILGKMMEAGMAPEAVVTQPDRPVGRKRMVQSPPVKQLAAKHGIEVWQPEKLKGNEKIAAKIRELAPDAIVVAAYGQMIPKEILDIPKKGCLNIHPSLLPKYRGASPMQFALMSGDKETGVSIMLLDEKMDHGPILTQEKWICEEKYYGQLSKELSEIGAKLLVETLPKWLEGRIEPKEQDHDKATYTRIISKKDGLIDWNKGAEEIACQVRALHLWPTAQANMTVKGRAKTLKIYRAKAFDCNANGKPGTIFCHNGTPAAVCGDKKCLLLEEVQLEGKKKMEGKDFIRGCKELIES